MFNSYIQKYGEPVGESSDELDELGCNIFCSFDFAPRAFSLVESSAACIIEEIKNSGLVLSQNDKAHLLDHSFHNANENLYEMEDEDENFNAAEAQSEFLAALVLALDAV